MRRDDIIPPESGGDEPAEEGRRIPPIIDQDDRSFVMRYLGPLIDGVQTRVRRFWRGLMFWLKRGVLVTLALAVLVIVVAQFISPDRSGNILHWQNLTQQLTQRVTGLWNDAAQPVPETAVAQAPDVEAPVTATLRVDQPPQVKVREEIRDDIQDDLQEAGPDDLPEGGIAPREPEIALADEATEPATIGLAQAEDTALAELARERAAHAATRTALLALQAAPPRPRAAQQDLVAALLIRIEAGQAYGAALGAIDDPALIDQQSRATLAAHVQGAPNIARLQKSYAILRAILMAAPGPSAASSEVAAPPAFAWLEETSRGLVHIKKAPPAPQSGAETETVPVARFDAMMAQGAFSEFHATLGALAPKAPANSTAAWQALSGEMVVYLHLQPVIATLKQNHLLEAGR